MLILDHLSKTEISHGFQCLPRSLINYTMLTCIHNQLKHIHTHPYAHIFTHPHTYEVTMTSQIWSHRYGEAAAPSLPVVHSTTRIIYVALNNKTCV